MRNPEPCDTPVIARPNRTSVLALWPHRVPAVTSIKTHVFPALRKTAILLMLTAAACAVHAEESINVALGRPYTLDPAPNYSGGTSKTGAEVLTDGKTTPGGTMWLQSGAVGWTHVRPVTITIDLGAAVTIDRVTWHGAAGSAGVEWPGSILAFGSVDGKNFSLLGNLVELDAARGSSPPPLDHYSDYTYSAKLPATDVRFLRLMADPSDPYLFVDEIQVFRAAQPAARAASLAIVDTTAAFWRAHAVIKAKQAISGDLSRIRGRLAALNLPASTRRQFEDQAATAAAAQISNLPATLGPRPTLPIGPAHTALYAALGAAENAAGQPPVQAWPADPWYPLTPEEVPNGQVPERVIIGGMHGERRSGAIDVRNNTAKAQDFLLSATVDGISAQQLSLAPVPWTGTQQSGWAATKIVGATSHVSVPAGITQQIWITFDAGNATPGLHSGSITVRSSSGGSPITVPVALRVFATQFPTHPAVLVQGWDYLQDPGRNSITPGNIEAVGPFLRSQGVNVAWATSTVFQFGQYDSAGHLSAPPPTDILDHWLTRWPDATRYRVFVSVKNDIAGIPLADPRFPVAVKEWANYWAAALKKRGHTPQSFELHLVDEPRNDAQAQTEIAWGQAIKGSGSGLRIWVNPNWPDPSSTPRALLDVADVVCVNLRIADTAGDKYWRWAQQLAASGKGVEIYGTDGPVSSLDPYAYYRSSFWRAHSIGALGVGFWSFSDAGGGESSDEFAIQGTDYAPYYLDRDGVTRSKHMEALSEGARDYEYLRLLALVAAKSKTPDQQHQAASLMEQAIPAVLSSAGTPYGPWTTPRNRTVADAWRFRIAAFLDQIDLLHLETTHESNKK